jgi:hypothetical protein
MGSLVISGRAFALLMFLLVSGAILASIHRVKNGGAVKLRTIAGYEALKEAVGRSVEMGSPIHFTAGYYAIGLEIMAGLQSLRHIAGLVAEYGGNLVATTAKGDTYTMAEGIVKQAYIEAGKPEAYKTEMVRYLSDSQFAFASGVMGIITREQVAANVMMGQFAAESLLFAETGYAAGAIQIAGTASIGQLPFFVATCDYVVIGEELFAANAYFGNDPLNLGCIRGQDLAKALCIGLILLGAVLQTAGSDLLLNLINK